VHETNATTQHEKLVGLILTRRRMEPPGSGLIPGGAGRPTAVACLVSQF